MFEIGPSRARERGAVDYITRATGAFVGEELDTPTRLFDEYLEDPAAPDGYKFLSCRLARHTIGFACYGVADFTVGTYDLYWIAVHPDHQGAGAARVLFRGVIDSLREVGGRLLMIWTSGRPSYARARRFYESVGCELEATIRDFYAPGDDLCIYSFRIEGAGSAAVG